MIHVDRRKPFSDRGEDIQAMPEREIEYLTRRAGQQLVLAQRATLPAVTAAHYRLANAYLERIAEAAPADDLSTSEPRGRR